MLYVLVWAGQTIRSDPAESNASAGSRQCTPHCKGDAPASVVWFGALIKGWFPAVRTRPASPVVTDFVADAFQLMADTGVVPGIISYEITELPRCSVELKM